MYTNKGFRTQQKNNTKKRGIVNSIEYSWGESPRDWAPVPECLAPGRHRPRRNLLLSFSLTTLGDPANCFLFLPFRPVIQYYMNTFEVGEVTPASWNSHRKCSVGEDSHNFGIKKILHIFYVSFQMLVWEIFSISWNIEIANPTSQPIPSRSESLKGPPC